MIGQAGTGSEKRGGLAVSQHEQEEPSGQIYTSINYWRAERERKKKGPQSGNWPAESSEATGGCHYIPAGIISK